MDFVSKLTELMAGAPFSQYGLTRLERPLSMAFYRQWIADGHHAGMEYLKTHIALKENPQSLAPRALSAIVAARQYLPNPYPEEKPKLTGVRKALYAQGEDYHSHFRNELETVAGQLRELFPQEEFLCFTDSAPILERDLAYRAGLGWVGKNTCLIHPQQGSLFFLGQILTSIPLVQEATAPMHDFCGSCDRCIRACPTGAIEEPRKLNAGKCISYWNIEARAAAPLDLRAQMGDWLFGCDICQTVCPWNEKKHGRDLMRELTAPKVQPAIEDLRWILTASGKELERALAATPLLRARPRGLKRNALIVVGNLKLKELREVVTPYLDDENLNTIAQWTLAQLN